MQKAEFLGVKQNFTIHYFSFFSEYQNFPRYEHFHHRKCIDYINDYMSRLNTKFQHKTSFHFTEFKFNSTLIYKFVVRKFSPGSRR